MEPPRIRSPVTGLPSGAGVSRAGLHDLARPHIKGVPNFISLSDNASREGIFKIMVDYFILNLILDKSADE